jgi:hypothetical protein
MSLEEEKIKFEKLADEMQDSINKNFVESLIKNNTIEFDYDNIKYHVRLPTFKEKQEVAKKRVEKYFALLKEKDSEGNYIYKLDVDLRKLYKERGMDIDIIDNDFTALESKRRLLQEKLGQALKDNKSDMELKAYKDEIETIEKSQRELTVKKAVLLEFSLENQLLIYLYTYVTFLTTEKLVEDKWVRVWPTYDLFEQEDEMLINRATGHISLLLATESL